jgi:hypothetical protein
MTCSTSEVAVCCSNDGLPREIAEQLDLPVGEGAHLLAEDADRAHQHTIHDHRHDQ